MLEPLLGHILFDTMAECCDADALKQEKGCDGECVFNLLCICDVLCFHQIFQFL